MKFHINDGTEIDLSPEISNNIIVINNTTFWYDNIQYTVQPIEFKIDDIYVMFYTLIKNNPNKKIFIHHFEPLSNDFYVVYLAISKT